MATDGSSTEFGAAPPKKPKIDSDCPSDLEPFGGSDSESHGSSRGSSGRKSLCCSGCKTDSKSGYIICGGRKIREGDIADEAYQLQLVEFYYQSKRSEGFEINWGQFDFLFGIKPVEWAQYDFEDEMTNDELVHMLTLYAIDEHNKEKGTNLEFVEHVKANYRECKGYNFWITFRARDESSPNPESKLYQTEVLYFFDEMEIFKFRPRPTDEEIASVYVPPAPPLCYDPDKPPKVFN